MRSKLIRFDEFVANISSSPMLGESLPYFGIPSADASRFFVPPLLLCEDRQKTPQITLVSARGAAGKSRAARELARQLKVPLWQLELDKAVSSTALERALIHYLGNADPRTAIAQMDDPVIVIDSLDEARARVSGISWNDFIESIALLAEHNLHALLFGRERTLEDLWVTLDDLGLYIDTWEISHFAPEQCNEYVDSAVRRRDKSADNTSVNYQRARNAITAAIAAALTPTHSDAFVGYPPVLDAVAANLIKKPNFLQIWQTFEDKSKHPTERMSVLKDILETLLKREQLKVDPIRNDLGLSDLDLYTPEEQVQWLCHFLETAPAPTLNVIDDAKLRADYAHRVSEFCEDHPYRSEGRWASPVFEAYVASLMFDKDAFSDQRLLAIGNTSGLLFDFVDRPERITIDEMRFAALHASVLASEWTDTQISASLEHPEAGSYAFEGSFQVHENRQFIRGLQFQLIPSEEGCLRLAGPLTDLSVHIDERVVVPTRSHGTVIGPDLFLRAAEITFEGATLDFARRSDADANRGEADASVVIEAVTSLRLPPESTRLPLEGELEIRVPEGVALQYPWISYASRLDDAVDPPHERALRFLNKFMSLTRRHGHKGEAGVFIMKFLGKQTLDNEKFRAAVKVLISHGSARLDGDILFMTDEWEKYRYNGKGFPGQTQYSDVSRAWEGIVREIEALL